MGRENRTSNCHMGAHSLEIIHFLSNFPFVGVVHGVGATKPTLFFIYLALFRETSRDHLDL